jgi:hypothetical protein
MDNHHVGDGSNTERARERPARAAGRHDVLIPRPPRREAAARAAELAVRARAEDTARRDLVARAVRRLREGGLDGEAVAAETARRLLAARFLDA